MNIQTPHKSELRPLPMRITQQQFERLQTARSRDGLSVQEHVRRALDFYLQKVERDAAKSPPPETVNGGVEQPPSAGGEPAMPAPPPLRRAAPKVRMR